MLKQKMSFTHFLKIIPAKNSRVDENREIV